MGIFCKGEKQRFEVIMIWIGIFLRVFFPPILICGVGRTRGLHLQFFILMGPLHTCIFMVYSYYPDLKVIHVKCSTF